jgi:glycosyltransferase involved in cell wall biosynthesis
VIRHLRDVTTWVAAEHHVALPPPPYNVEAVDAIRAAGAAIHHVDMRRTPPHPANLAALVRLRRLIGRLQPDVVHGHASVGGALARLAAAGSRGVPVAYSPHSLGPAQASRLAASAERVLGPLTTRLVAVSAGEAAEAARLGLVPPERIVVIPNGISLRPPPPPSPGLREMLGVGADEPLVGMVARLAPQKDPVTFARACGLLAARRPAARFVLIGDGPLRRAVEAEVAAAGVGDRLQLLDRVADAGPLVGELDVFVLATTFEGAPYAPLEAMRANVPVVLSDVVGNRDVVEPGTSGLLVPAGDPAALASAVVRLLDDQSLRQALAAAAAERLRQRFDVARMGATLTDLYWNLSRSDPSRSDPSRSDPSRSDPSRSDPSRSDPSRSDPSRSDLSAGGRDGPG